MILRKCYHKSQQLAEALNNVCIDLDHRYNINNGGCCYIAYLLCKLLKKDGFNPKLIVYDFDWDYEEINSINDLYFAHNHYCLKLGDTLINDADYDLDHIELNNIKPIDLLHHYKEGDWNSEYNTSYNNKIAKILKNRYFGITSSLRKKRNFCKSWK